MAPAKILKVSIVFGSVVLFLMSGTSFALQDGVARTPPMGWNSWNYFACNLITEDVVLMTAQAFVKKHPANWEGKQISMLDVGYKYVCIDDCWGKGTRTALGQLQINTIKFPHSTDNTFNWLSDSLHNMALKFGIYTSNGTSTCQQTQPGSCSHEESDASQFASWGVDFIKNDCCFSEGCNGGTPNQQLYVKMRDAVKKTGRPMVLSLCEYGKSSPWLWGDTVGHMWRTNYDITADWGSVLGRVDENTSRQLYRYAHPGAWNDPDMLEVGNGSLTLAENQSHFDLWCMQASPLLKGNDLSRMTEEVFTILSNREVIAVDQDSLGVQGRRVRQIGTTIDIYVKKMKSADTLLNRKFAVVLLNRTTGSLSGSVKWADFGELNPKAKYVVRDLWKHTNLDTAATDSVRATMAGHGTVHLLLTRVPPPVSALEIPVSINALSAQLESRTSALGIEIYIPASNSKVQIFNAQGEMIASFSTSHPSWYPVSDKLSLYGIYIVCVKTSSGFLAKELLLAR